MIPDDVRAGLEHAIGCCYVHGCGHLIDLVDKAQDWLDSQTTQPEPEWEKYPEAKAWAIDEDGTEHYYDHDYIYTEDHHDGGYWTGPVAYADQGRTFDPDKIFYSWKDTYRERPDGA